MVKFLSVSLVICLCLAYSQAFWECWKLRRCGDYLKCVGHKCVAMCGDVGDSPVCAKYAVCEPGRDNPKCRCAQGYQSPNPWQQHCTPIKSTGQRNPSVPNVLPSSGKWSNVGSKTFSLHDTESSWYDAMALCRSKGLELATVRSHQEQSALEDLFINHGLKGNKYWIGANDLEKHGVFAWEVFPGERQDMLFTSWGSGQPGLSLEWSCVLLGQDRFNWATRRCGDSLPYICQTPTEQDENKHL